jgi:hypothetical protein
VDADQRRPAVPDLHHERRTPGIGVSEPMKILSMDISFSSNPEDPGFREVQKNLESVLES